MSHVSENQTNIRQTHEGILQETLELVVAATPGMEVKQAFKNWGMSDVKCDVAIFTPGMKRGIGINFKNGPLTFVGDSYGAESEYNKTMAVIKQTYYTVAAKKALEAIDYTVETPTMNARGNYVLEAHA